MPPLDVYYDLATSPPTYEIVTFLCRAECERRERGADGLRIIVLPGPLDGFRCDRLWPYGAAARLGMMSDVVLPICDLLPSVQAVDWRGSRRDVPPGGLGVGRKWYGFQEQVSACRKGVRPLRPRRPVVPAPGLITITLREASHWPDRNSDLPEWVAAAEALEDSGWRVVFVRDTEKAGERIPGFDTDADAARDIGARAALYASAELNLFVSNGPAWLCAAMDLPALIFKPIHEGSIHVFAAEHLRACGVQKGGQIPGAPPWQRLVWVPDTAGIIVAAVSGFFVERRQQQCRA